MSICSSWVSVKSISSRFTVLGFRDSIKRPKSSFKLLLISVLKETFGRTSVKLDSLGILTILTDLSSVSFLMVDFK